MKLNKNFPSLTKCNLRALKKFLSSLKESDYANEKKLREALRSKTADFSEIGALPL